MISKIFTSLSDDIVREIDQYAGFCICDEEQVYKEIKEFIKLQQHYGNKYVSLYYDTYYIQIFRDGNNIIMFPMSKEMFEQEQELDYGQSCDKVKYFEIKVPGTTVDSIDPDGKFFFLSRKEIYQARTYK
jgi:hypothetical protein